MQTYIYTASREYAKVTGGGAASISALTDTAQSQAEKLLNSAKSPEAFEAIVNAMKNDMSNVNNEYGKSIGQYAPNVANLLGAASGGTVDPTLGFGSPASTIGGPTSQTTPSGIGYTVLQ